LTPGFVFRLALVLVLAGLAAACWACFVEPHMIRLERVNVPIDSLPDALDGFTIGVISDLHLDTTPFSVVRRAADLLAKANPNITVVLGDLAGAPSLIDSINQAIEPLGQPYGVRGNWDRWWEAESLRDRVNLHMLVNSGQLVAPGLWVGGVDDALVGSPSIDEAMAEDTGDSIRILLAHEPDIALAVKPEHRISLQISGHSHGGQVCLPFVGALLLPPLGSQYPVGLQEAPTHWVYTTRGVGMSHIPVRFLCLPEISLITLVKRPS
jgi:predicted MPP superfamily phosphohydrolase